MPYHGRPVIPPIAPADPTPANGSQNRARSNHWSYSRDLQTSNSASNPSVPLHRRPFPPPAVGAFRGLVAFSVPIARLPKVFPATTRKITCVELHSPAHPLPLSFCFSTRSNPNTAVFFFYLSQQQHRSSSSTLSLSKNLQFLFIYSSRRKQQGKKRVHRSLVNACFHNRLICFGVVGLNPWHRAICTEKATKSAGRSLHSSRNVALCLGWTLGCALR